MEVAHVPVKATVKFYFEYYVRACAVFFKEDDACIK